MPKRMSAPSAAEGVPQLDVAWEDVHAFVPYRLLGLAFASQPSDAAEAHFDGAVLLTDISGYSRLTERLAIAGQDGLDRLRRILNQAFGSHVEHVLAHGGEVVHFAGDAILSCWPAQGSLAAATRAASECGRSLHAARDHDPRSSLPDVHSGVGAGALWAGRVGGEPHHWDLLLGGPATRQAARAVAAARRGELCVSDEAQAAMDGVFERGAESAAPREAPQGLTHDWLGGFLPTFLRDRLLTPHRQWLGEIRQVSAIFVRIGGLDERDPGTLKAHHEVARALEDVLSGLAGPPGKLVIDDKGLVFHAAFGSHLGSSADSPALAVEAAMAMNQRLRCMGLGAAVGVSTGSAFCGLIGSERRLGYETVGSVMNTAAGLMVAAGEGVLCDVATVAGATGRVCFDAPWALYAKGSETGIAVCRPICRLRRAFRARVSVGRQREVERMRAALLAAKQGRVLVACLRGDAGFGKTHLARRTLQEAESHGLRCAAGEADSVERTTSFLVWRQVFETLLGAERGGTPASLRGALARCLERNPQLAQRAPLVRAVLPLELEDNDTTRHLHGQARADMTLQFLVELLTALCPDPVAIVLDDCHWMDSASWRLAARVVSALPAGLLVLSMRNDAPEPAELAAMRDAVAVEVIDVGALEATDMSGLLAAVLGGAPVDAAVSQAVFERTMGNPLFAEELALALRDCGHIVAREGAWRLATGAALENVTTPPTVQGLITNRVDRLGPAPKLALKTASVIGRAFSAHLLCAAYPVREETHLLATALECLVDGQFLVREDSPGTYAFRHAVIREVCYGLMLREQRRDLHEAVASGIETIAADLAPHYATLAHHWRSAERDEPTLRYSDLAAESALRTGAFSEAVRFLEDCLALARTSPRRPIDAVRWRRMLAESWNGLGDVSKRGGEALQAIALTGKTVPAARSRLVAGVAGQTSLMLLRMALPHPLVVRSHAASKERHLELARAFSQAAAGYFFANRALETLYASIHSLLHAQRVGPSQELSRAYTEFGGIFGLVGLPLLGERLFARARDTAAAIGDPASLGYVHMVYGLYLVGIGRWDDCADALDRCQELCERAGDHVNWGNAEAMRFWRAHYRGEPAEADQAAARLEARAARIGNAQHMTWVLRYHGVRLLSRGDAPQAARTFAQCLERSDANRDGTGAICALGGLALAHQRSGDRDESLEAAENGLTRLQAVQRHVGHVMLEGCSGVAETLLRAREAGWPQRTAAQWARRTRAAVIELKKYTRAFPVGRPRTGLWHGLALWLDGNKARAEGVWRRALHEATALQMRDDAHRIREELRAKALHPEA